MFVLGNNQLLGPNIFPEVSRPRIVVPLWRRQGAGSVESWGGCLSSGSKGEKGQWGLSVKRGIMAIR
jgi:hypothetical protein